MNTRTNRYGQQRMSESLGAHESPLVRAINRWVTLTEPNIVGVRKQERIRDLVRRAEKGRVHVQVWENGLLTVIDFDAPAHKLARV